MNDGHGGDDHVASRRPLLSYELRTRHPTRRGNVRMVIDETGGVRVQRNDSEPPQGQEWAAELPREPLTEIADARSRLRGLLESGHFFEMDEHQVNDAANDGTVRSLTWTGDRGPRTVTIDRAKSPEFDRIIAELARLTSVPGL